MSPRDHFYPYLYHCDYIGLLGTDFMQVFHLGRAPRTKETLPDFLKWRRVNRHPLVFRGLTGSQRTPGFWGVTRSTKIGLQVFVGTESKIDLRDESYVWTPKSWSFVKLHKV